MQLTPHFKLSEFIRSDAAVRLKNDNLPDTEEHMGNLHALANTMERVRGLFEGAPVNISSGYRNKVVNADVGGVPNSDHCEGRACDFMVAGFTKEEIVRRIREEGCFPFDQLIDEPTWVHISIGVRMRREVLRARRNSVGKMVYTPM